MVNDSQLVPSGVAPGGAVLLFESANGAVHASLRLIGMRAGRVMFALGVINGTREPLLVTFYGHVRGGGEVPIDPYALWVDPNTHAHLDVPLPWLALLGTRAVSARLQGRNVHQRVEAAMPRMRSPLWFLAGIAATVLVVVGASALRPSVAALSAPARVVTGTALEVAYATHGSGARSWELDTLNGARVAGAALASASGTVRIDAPRTDRERTYVLRVRVDGLAGSDQAMRPLVVQTPVPANPPPRITSFALDRTNVADGGTVVARYRIDAQSGDVLANDAQGTIWAQAPTNASGVTILQLPRFGRRKELQIRLVVRRGSQLAASGLGIVVTPQ